MRLIALVTSTPEPSLCMRDGARILGAWRGSARSGPRPILMAVRNLLQETSLDFDALDGIAFGRGPGPFTGVRLGAAIAQGLALGTGLALLPISDLAALAWNALRRHGWPRVLACLDARQGEVYWGAYIHPPDTGSAVQGVEHLAAPQTLVPPPGDWAWAGSGAALITAARYAQEFDPALAPDAEAVAELGMQALARGEKATLVQAMPQYLRERVARASPRYLRRRTTLQ